MILPVWCWTKLMMIKPFSAQIYFTDEATFRMNRCVNRHNCRIWGSEQPNEFREWVRRSAKGNVWCGLLCDRVAGPFFFAEITITGGIYQDMLENIVYGENTRDLRHLLDRMAAANVTVTPDMIQRTWHEIEQYRYLPSDKWSAYRIILARQKFQIFLSNLMFESYRYV
jgi:hypothetical protein